MPFYTEAVVAGQDLFVSSTTPKASVGARMSMQDGRVFRYAKAGSVALVAGNVVQGAPTIAAHLGNTPPVVPIGSTVFTYTPGAATAAAGYYSDGILQVDTGPGAGYSYVVGGHDAIASSTAFALSLRDPIQVGLTGASRVGLIPNPYNGVVQMPVTTATGVLAGVAPYVINANEYGWLQTWGLCSCLVTGTPALGAQVMAPGTAAGAMEVVTTTNLVVAQFVGQMAQVGAGSGKFNAVYLKIAP
jgi:hypothetical protein